MANDAGIIAELLSRRLIARGAVGDAAQLSYTASAGILTVHQFTVTATPEPPSGEPGQPPLAGSPGPPAPCGPPATASQG